MNTKEIFRTQSFVYGLILLIINPIVALIMAILNFRFKESKTIAILFFGVFGLTMIIQEGKDANVHKDFFINSYINKDFETFKTETKNILLLKANENDGKTNVDLYLHFVSYITAKFSSNPAILFFVVSLIYGLLYIRGIRLVYEKVESNWTFLLSTLFILFIFWKSLEGINSIRNWTAAWIFFNGALSYFDTKQKKFLYLILLAPLIHFAYFIIVAPFFLIFLFGNRPFLYCSILVISFFISFQNVELIYKYLAVTDLGLQKMGYISDETSSYLVEGSGQTFHAKYYLLFGKLVVSALFYSGLVVFNYFKNSKKMFFISSLASMGILMAAFSNFLSISPVVNKRIFTNAGLYMLAYLIICYGQKLKEPLTFKFYSFKAIIIILIPLMTVFIFTQLSNIGDFTDTKIFVSPVIYALFEGEYSLKELLRSLF